MYTIRYRDWQTDSLTEIPAETEGKTKDSITNSVAENCWHRYQMSRHPQVFSESRQQHWPYFSPAIRWPKDWWPACYRVQRHSSSFTVQSMFVFMCLHGRVWYSTLVTVTGTYEINGCEITSKRTRGWRRSLHWRYLWKYGNGRESVFTQISNRVLPLPSTPVVRFSSLPSPIYCLKYRLDAVPAKHGYVT